MEFRFYLSLFLRRLHWFLIVAVLASAAGIGIAWVLPTVFVAQATLVVESEQIPDNLAASTVQTQATEQLQIIRQRILARDTLVEMGRRLQIYAPLPGEQPRQMEADELVEDLRERIKIVTTGGSVPRGPTQATLVTVSFEAPSAAMAAAVANDVVTQILKINVEMRTGSARQTLDFFEQEVARLNKELADHGAQVLKFKEANKGALPESLGFARDQQITAQSRYQQLLAAEGALIEQRARLVRLHDAVQAGALGDLTAGQAQTAEQQQLRALKDQLASQKLVLSPENPKIKLLQSQIDALGKALAGQAASGLPNEQGKAMSAYDVQLADIDARLADLDKQKQGVEAQIVRLQALIDAIPANAIALDVLQRDYDNTKTQYDLAVNNKARAETGDTIETLSKGQRITVIEQAVAPREPTRPNRNAIAAGGLGGGLVLGFGLVMLIELLQSGIRRPAELTTKLGITAFATLPYMKTAREIRRRRLRVVLILLFILGGTAAALWAVDTYYMPLDLLLDRVIKRLTLLARPLA